MTEINHGQKAEIKLSGKLRFTTNSKKRLEIVIPHTQPMLVDENFLSKFLEKNMGFKIFKSEVSEHGK